MIDAGLEEIKIVDCLSTTGVTYMLIRCTMLEWDEIQHTKHILIIGPIANTY